LGGDEDHPSVAVRRVAEPVGQVGAVLLAQADVDQDDVGVMLLGGADRPAAGVVLATTVIPPRCRRVRAVSVNPGLSSTLRARRGIGPTMPPGRVARSHRS
jgi:hypothetical protein